MMQKFSMCLWRKVVILLMLAGVCVIPAGCSAGRLAYGNGESLSFWWINSYIDLDTQQGSAAKAHLAALFEWHRRTQLPEYVQWLGTIESRLQAPVTGAELDADVAGLKQRVRRITERAALSLADLALTLQPAQIERLRSKLAAGNDTWRSEHLEGDVAERQARRFKRVMQQAEYWFGDFSDAQEVQIRAASDARPLDPERVYADRLQRQQALIALLDKIRTERPTRAAATEMIRAMLDPDRPHDGAPDTQAFFDRQQAANNRLVLAVMNTTTVTQRKKAATQVRQWMRDLTALSRT
jgi:hypothetical protein